MHVVVTALCNQPEATETSLFRLTSDVYNAVDNKSETLLVALDLSAASTLPLSSVVWNTASASVEPFSSGSHPISVSGNSLHELVIASQARSHACTTVSHKALFLGLYCSLSTFHPLPALSLNRTGDWNLQDWKMTDHQKTGDGICKTGKWRTKSQGWNLQDWKMTDWKWRTRKWRSRTRANVYTAYDEKL